MNTTNNFQNFDFQQIKANGTPFICPVCASYISFSFWADWKEHWYKLHNRQYSEYVKKLLSRNHNVNKKWIKFASFPITLYAVHTGVGQLISTNANEFVAILSRSNRHYKYNVKTNAFKSFVELGYPISLIDRDQGLPTKVAFDKRENKIYYFPNNTNALHSINLTTTTHNIIKEFPLDGEYFLFANNYFHIFSNHHRHWIGSIQNKKLKTIHNTLASNEISPESPLQDAKAIYISSKQCIVLIGGHYGVPGSGNTELWIYSLISQQWTKINHISFQASGFGVVLSSNQRYIVLIGGYKAYHRTNKVFVMDMKDNNSNNWKIRQSTILAPYSGRCCITRTGGFDSKDEILVTGYIRQCFKMKAFQHLTLPPVYIIMRIVKWFSAEMIHWIKNNFYDHYAIYLKDILSSLRD